VLLEEYIARLEERIEKEVKKGQKRFKDAFDEAQFRATNPNVLREQEEDRPRERQDSRGFEHRQPERTKTIDH